MLRRLLGRSRRGGACVGALVLMALTLLLFAGASSEAAYAAQSRNEASEQIRALPYGAMCVRGYPGLPTALMPSMAI